MRKHTTILLILISLFFTSSVNSQWYEQTLPVSATINDMVFFNASTGLIAMSNTNILRTTNGGDNWTIAAPIYLYTIKKVDSVAAFGLGYSLALASKMIFKTTDKGVTWDSIIPSTLLMSDIWFANRDTGWMPLGGTGSQNGLYKTTNGGTTITKITGDISGGKFSFLNKKYNGEYFGWDVQQQGLYITTNSGVNWVKSQGLDSLNLGSACFINKDTGWVSGATNFSIGRIYYTSSGGANWIKQYQEFIHSPADMSFPTFNWGWGGRDDTKIFATSNGGVNWGFQTIPLFRVRQMYMIDSLVGWAGNGQLIHTTNGGGNIVKIKTENNYNPSSYILKQNYPNPFNPTSFIEFSIKYKANVSLVIYDMQGKEIEKLFSNKELIPGNYKSIANFSDKNLSSGIYFYKLIISGKEDLELTKKMTFVK